MNQLDRLNELIRAPRQEVIVNGRYAIGEAFRELFIHYPDVARISWSQYTPHFNDGDVCEFEVGDLYMVKKCDLEEAIKDEREAPDYDYQTCHQGSRDPAERDFYNLFNSIETEMMLLVFGDGYWVRITRDDIQVEEYDHD